MGASSPATDLGRFDSQRARGDVTCFSKSRQALLSAPGMMGSDEGTGKKRQGIRNQQVEPQRHRDTEKNMHDAEISNSSCLISVSLCLCGSISPSSSNEKGG